MRQSGQVAYLSGANEYGTANVYVRHCAVERAFPLLASNASATEAWAQGEATLAEREARRILGETEPRIVEHHEAQSVMTSAYVNHRIYGMGTDTDFALTSLADALAAVLPVLEALEAEARQ